MYKRQERNRAAIFHLYATSTTSEKQRDPAQYANLRRDTGVAARVTLHLASFGVRTEPFFCTSRCSVPNESDRDLVRVYYDSINIGLWGFFFLVGAIDERNSDGRRYGTLYDRRGIMV